MKLHTDPEGRVYVVGGPPPIDSPFIGGLAFSNLGQVYTTGAVLPTDNNIGGWRVSALGELVCTVGVVGQEPYDFNAGMPQANEAGVPPRPGAMICQVDVIPLVNNPYVAGVRVGLPGGMYQTTAIPT